MEKIGATPGPSFTQPLRQIASMLAVLALVAVGAWVGRAVVADIFLVNVWLNGFIVLVFALGVLTCFWQLVQLVVSVSWITGFVARRPGFDATGAPQLMASLAALLGQRAARMQISTIAQRSILDSVAQRLDETRDIARYLGNLLIFLGLLGTFYGLATTIPAMVETIRNLAPQEGESGTAVFTKLMNGLEAQLGGMGTAFASSLFGLAGSLVIGLLDLFSGHGQGRFYRELEEWLSTITRVGLAPGETEGEGSGSAAYTNELVEAIEALAAQVAAQTQAVSDRDATQSNTLAVLAGRMAASETRMVELAGALNRLMPPDPGPQIALLDRIARAQEAQGGRVAASEARMGDLAGALSRLAPPDPGPQIALLDRIARANEALADPESSANSDAESRMRLRSIDVQLLRILEEISAGRQESISDLRTDMAALTAAVRQLGRGAGPR